MAQPLDFRRLNEDVVRNNLCTGCSACVVVCPWNAIEYDFQEEIPKRIGDCMYWCSYCTSICPQVPGRMAEIEDFVFSRQRQADEEMGIYRRMIVARSKSPEILGVGEDGGTVTQILAWALDTSIINGALVCSVDKQNGWKPEPKLVRTKAELIRCAGNSYVYSPNLLKVVSGYDVDKLGLVTVPCQISAARTMEAAHMKLASQRISLNIGLLCLECFAPEFLYQKVQAEAGINLADVEKINVKGRVELETRSGEIREIPLKEAVRYTRQACLSCADFTAEAADISVGGLGLRGWTLVITRTSKGDNIIERMLEEDILESRPIEEFPTTQKLLLRLTRKKKARAAEWWRAQRPIGPLPIGAGWVVESG